jgi:hypothetical protein
MQIRSYLYVSATQPLFLEAVFTPPNNFLPIANLQILYISRLRSSDHHNLSIFCQITQVALSVGMYKLFLVAPQAIVA